MAASRRITDGTVAKGSLWNLAGLGLPLLAALIAVPLIVHGLGTERFGVLALTWAIVGAASMLDLGVGRALTQLVATRNAAGDDTDLAALVASATAWLAILGALAAGFFVAAAPWLANHFFRVDAALAGEAERAIRLLGLSLPFLLCSGALQGVLEGYFRFDLSNLVRIPLSLSNYLIPLAILPFKPDLAWIVGGTVVARVIALLAYARLVSTALNTRNLRFRLRADLVPVLFAMAGWMTVSSIVATTIVYLDRFVIAALASMSAVAYYATPYELVSRLSLLPGAVGAALLPVFSSVSQGTPKDLELVFGRGLRYVVLLVFPATMFIVLFAPEGLALWLSEEFAAASSAIAQILAVGVFVNSLAIIPLIFLYGVGRADAVARLHLAELPVYVILLWQLVTHFGAKGAAVAWTIRVTIDALLLFAMARRLYPTHDFRYRRVALATAGGLAALVIGIAIPSATARAIYGFAGLGTFGLYAWLWLLTPAERNALKFRI